MHYNIAGTEDFRLKFKIFNKDRMTYDVEILHNHITDYQQHKMNLLF